jgi:hypothetical protein
MDGTSEIALNINASGSAYTHNVLWYVPDENGIALPGYVSQDLSAGDLSSVLTVPANWCEEFPNGITGTAYVRLETYNGASLIGDNTYSFTVTVPASVVPTIASVTAALVANGVPEAITKYVQSHSKTTIAINTAAGVYGSTIASYLITGGGFSAATASATLGPLPTAGSITFSGKVTDSRGRTATKTVTITVQAYTKPTLLNQAIYRCLSNGTADSAGTYARLYAKNVFSSIDGQNSVTLQGRVYMKGATPPSFTTMTSETAWIAGAGALLTTKTYIGEIKITDLLYNYTFSAQIPTDIVGLHILDGVTGAAIGKYAETPGQFEIPTTWGTNITPAQVGAAAVEHEHSIADLTDLSVGGTNLLLGSGVEYKNNLYGMYTYVPSSPLVAGETYTISMLVTPAANVTYYTPFLSSGYFPLGNLVVSGTSQQLVKKTFVAGYYAGKTPSDNIAHANVVIYRYPNGGEVTTDSTIHWIKIEVGNVPTDWSPAPADIVLAAHPVGCIYLSDVSTSPATLFGGTWSAISSPPTGAAYWWKRTA